jgi:hypothetical protein
MPGISETLHGVYFFDKYLTAGLAIGEMKHHLTDHSR